MKLYNKPDLKKMEKNNDQTQLALRLDKSEACPKTGTASMLLTYMEMLIEDIHPHYLYEAHNKAWSWAYIVSLEDYRMEKRS